MLRSKSVLVVVLSVTGIIAVGFGLWVVLASQTPAANPRYPTTDSSDAATSQPSWPMVAPGELHYQISPLQTSFGIESKKTSPGTS